MVIDFHTNVGYGSDGFLDPEALLREMDAAKVDKAVICPADRYLAVYNKEGNEYVANAVKAHPDRFIGFGCASPWYGEDGAAEVRRFQALGLKGLKVHSFYQGFLLCDHILDPILSACEAFSLPVLAHTGTPISAMPFQLRELALRFPGVVFIMGHMGFSDFWYDASVAAKGLPNMYLEWSYQMHAVIEEALASLGASRLLFGSDWPFSREKLELQKACLAEEGGARELLLGGNAARILGIGGAGI